MLVLAAAPPYYLFLPKSLNSLDREGVRLLSPMTHRLLPKPDAGADDVITGNATGLKWEFDEDSGRYYASFPDDQ